jgi:hypothetical protein
MREVAPGLVHWTAFHDGIGADVSSYWLADERVLLNPLHPPEGLGEPVAIVLTNRHHYRDSGELAERFGCRVRAPREGMHEFTRGEPVDPYGDADAPAPGLVAHHIGAISDDEYAVEAPRVRAVAVADGVVRRQKGGRLSFVPDHLMGDDPEAVKDGLLEAYQRLLDDVEFDHLLLAHGDPFVGDGATVLRSFVSRERRSG